MNNETGPSIHFNNINVGGVQINSGIFIGENCQCSWSAHAKNNSGIGTTNGKNTLYQPIDFVIDVDLSDYQGQRQKE
ncbi:MAG TPA: hypothetical protein VFK33_08990 [Bacillales bacterium]|nr:hypothetical protein [Bacillales bacterium]